MYFLERDAEGYLVLNKAGRKLLDQFYKPPKQHGKRKMFNNKKIEVTR